MNVQKSQNSRHSSCPKHPDMSRHKKTHSLSVASLGGVPILRSNDRHALTRRVKCGSPVFTLLVFPANKIPRVCYDEMKTLPCFLKKTYMNNSLYTPMNLTSISLS